MTKKIGNYGDRMLQEQSVCISSETNPASWLSVAFPEFRYNPVKNDSDMFSDHEMVMFSEEDCKIPKPNLHSFKKKEIPKPESLLPPAKYQPSSHGASSVQLQTPYHAPSLPTNTCSTTNYSQEDIHV